VQGCGDAVKNEISAQDKARSERTVRVSGPVAAIAMIVGCFVLTAVHNWLNGLADKLSIPGFLAFDIVIILLLAEGFFWLARQNAQVQSGDIAEKAGLTVRFKRLVFVIMAEDQ